MEEKEVKFTEEEIKNFQIACDKLCKLVKQLVDNIQEIINPIIDNLSAWLDQTTFTKRQFMHILQELGYSFEDAKKIAWKYYIQEGKYTLKHYLIEKQKKEEMDNVVKH